MFVAARGYAVTFCMIEASPTANRGNKGPDDVLATIWDLEETQQPLFQFRPPLAKIKQASLSVEQDALSINGKDFQGRELILVYAF